MPDHISKRPGRNSNRPRRRVNPNGGSHGGADGNRALARRNGKPRRDVNGNRLGKANGGRGETAVCIKCGHPAPDGKLCTFHRMLLNTFRKEMPEQDPRRFRL